MPALACRQNNSQLFSSDGSKEVSKWMDTAEICTNQSRRIEPGVRGCWYLPAVGIYLVVNNQGNSIAAWAIVLHDQTNDGPAGVLPLLVLDSTWKY